MHGFKTSSEQVNVLVHAFDAYAKVARYMYMWTDSRL